MATGPKYFYGDKATCRGVPEASRHFHCKSECFRDSSGSFTTFPRDSASVTIAMAKPRLELVASATVKRTVTPRRRPNGDIRTREYLTEAEIEKLANAARGQPPRAPRRHDGLRGLRAWPTGVRTGGPALGLGRLQNGHPALPQTQAGHAERSPILGNELRALRRLQRDQEPKSPFVFTSERSSPFTTAGFARMVERAGIEARLGFKVHPHMLRHACGYALANRGHDTRALQAYLGHKNIQHTVRYTELSPLRFKDFWRT
jgi:integrase